MINGDVTIDTSEGYDTPWASMEPLIVINGDLFGFQSAENLRVASMEPLIVINGDFCFPARLAGRTTCFNGAVDRDQRRQGRVSGLTLR